MTLTDFVNTFWAVLTVAANILSIVLVVALCSPSFRKNPIPAFFRNNSVKVAFIVSLLATTGSLVYSNVIGYEPCELCWFQRIFMYPQVLIMLIALIRKDSFIRVYGFALSCVGAAIALYHYFLQMGVNPLGLPCAAVGYSVSCAKNFVLVFGYVTIPVMALSAFILMALSFALTFKKEEAETIA